MPEQNDPAPASLPDAPIDALAVGATFGPFEIVAPVGRGAFGVVYEARRRPLNRRVALKVLHPHVLARPEALKRFERELAAAAAVEHPHVIAVLDGGVLEGRGYMAMTFLDGESLADRLRARAPLSVEDAVDALLPIAAALEAVHAAGIVHRDIKPANVFLARGASGGDHPVLLDFGIAKDLEDPGADLTRSQSWLGTPTYMSPEQVRQSKDVSAASDQWSFGVLLYECVVGARPFDDEVLLELMKAITTETPRSPEALRPSVPKGLSDAVMRMLSREPGARFASMRSVAEALHPFASERVRAWWRPRYGAPALASRAETVLETTAVREESPRSDVPGRLPDPDGALPTLMANRPAISAPPVPLTKRQAPASTPSPSTTSGQSADREPTVIVTTPKSASETLLRYAGVAAIAGLAFVAGRNITQPAVAPPERPFVAADPAPPAPQPTAPTPAAPAVVDAAAPAAAVDAGREVADVTVDVPRAPTRAENPRPRSGSIQIFCGTGRAFIGDDGRDREVTLPQPDPIAWPAGHVRVMIVTPNGQSQSYVDVRSGQTTPFHNCPGM